MRQTHFTDCESEFKHFLHVHVSLELLGQHYQPLKHHMPVSLPFKGKDRFKKLPGAKLLRHYTFIQKDVAYLSCEIV